VHGFILNGFRTSLGRATGCTTWAVVTALMLANVANGGAFAPAKRFFRLRPAHWISVASPQAFADSFKRSSYGQLVNDPAMQPFVESFRKQLAESGRRTTGQTGPHARRSRCDSRRRNRRRCDRAAARPARHGPSRRYHWPRRRDRTGAPYRCGAARRTEGHDGGGWRACRRKSPSTDSRPMPGRRRPGGSAHERQRGHRSGSGHTHRR